MGHNITKKERGLFKLNNDVPYYVVTRNEWERKGNIPRELVAILNEHNVLIFKG